MAKEMLTRSEALKPAWERGANLEQLDVIRHEDGPCRVLSAAGSGKTFALTRRIVRLVNVTGIPGKRILAMTFSKKAADEMSKRVKDLGVHDARVGTWHSLCLQILIEEKVKNNRGDVVSDWEIDDTGRAKFVLKDVLGFKGMDWKGHDLGQMNNFITRCKANIFAPDSPEASALAQKMFGREGSKACEAFHRYNEAIADKGLLTFDDMMIFVIDHFKNDESSRQKWAAKYDKGLCDEVQDNNGAQECLSSLLFRDHGNYMAIGDCFQAIYSFRGSSPAYLANFTKYWPEARTILLPSNYRSGKKIIEVANNIVRYAKIEGLEPTPMVAMREEEGEVRVISAESLDDEANEVANAIQKSVENGESELSDHTVLYRTNAQSRGIEEALLNRRISYQVVGGVSFYDRKEVRDLLAYLRLAACRGKLDDIKRSINTPFRFLGAKFVERVTEAAESADVETIKDWPTLIETVADGEGLQARQRSSAKDWAGMLRDMQKAMAEGLGPKATPLQVAEAKPAVLLEAVVSRTRYIDFINREEGSESTENSGAANVREMVRVAERFSTADELLDYIDDTLLKARKQRRDKQAGGERVLLMTAHRSKGLEWPNVYVIGMNEMILPHVRGDIEEERRIAYVATTRARDVLTISFVRRIAVRAGIKEAHPSRFLIDTGLSLDAPRVKQPPWPGAIVTPGLIEESFLDGVPGANPTDT